MPVPPTMRPAPKTKNTIIFRCRKEARGPRVHARACHVALGGMLRSKPTPKGWPAERTVTLYPARATVIERADRGVGDTHRIYAGVWP